jgi:hypothetical protein
MVRLLPACCSHTRASQPRRGHWACCSRASPQPASHRAWSTPRWRAATRVTSPTSACGPSACRGPAPPTSCVRLHRRHRPAPGRRRPHGDQSLPAPQPPDWVRAHPKRYGTGWVNSHHGVKGQGGPRTRVRMMMSSAAGYRRQVRQCPAARIRGEFSQQSDPRLIRPAPHHISSHFRFHVRQRTRVAHVLRTHGSHPPYVFFLTCPSTHPLSVCALVLAGLVRARLFTQRKGLRF